MRLFPKAIFSFLLLSFSSPSIAYEQSLEKSEIEEKNPEYVAMEKLNFLVGNWAGEGVSYSSDGMVSEYYDEEFVRYDLDGQILLINARGSRDGKTSYQLHTVIYFDSKAGHYIYSPYSAKGTRPFTCDLIGQQFICYTQSRDFRLIFQRLPNGKWNEYGERKNGDIWRKTFETKLSTVP